MSSPLGIVPDRLTRASQIACGVGSVDRTTVGAHHVLGEHEPLEVVSVHFHVSNVPCSLLGVNPLPKISYDNSSLSSRRTTCMKSSNCERVISIDCSSPPCFQMTTPVSPLYSALKNPLWARIDVETLTWLMTEPSVRTHQRTQSTQPEASCSPARAPCRCRIPTWLAR